MPDQLNPEFEFRRLAQRIDDPSARSVVVIIVESDGQVSTASRGVPNDTELFRILHHLCEGIAEELVPLLKDKIERQARRPRILMPWRNGWAK